MLMDIMEKLTPFKLALNTISASLTTMLPFYKVDLSSILIYFSKIKNKA